MPVVLICWRAVLVLSMALFPWGAPLEAHLSGDLRMQIGLGFSVLLVIIAIAIRRIETLGRKDPASLLLLLSVVIALGSAAILPRNYIPLSWGSLAVVVPFWSAILLWLRRSFSKSRAIPVLTVLFALGSWAIGAPRVTAREGVWRVVVEQNQRWVQAHLGLLAAVTARRAAPAEVASVAENCASLCPQAMECLRIALAGTLRRSDWEKSLELARRGLQLLPTDSEFLDAQGRAVTGLGRYDQASLAALRAALDAQPTDQRRRMNLAQALERAGRFGDSLNVLTATPIADEISNQQRIASVAIQAENWVVARTATDRVLAREPENVIARLNLGVIEQAEGHFNRAREAYLRALRTDPRNFAARYNLARLVFSIGATDEALHHAQRLLELDARDARVRVLVREIQDRIFDSVADAGAPNRPSR